MDDCGYSGRLRKRKRAVADDGSESVRSLLELVENASGKLVIFSGSGLSANSGMSMFTTKNGLYERARHKFKIQDGMKLFSYPFYKQRRKDLQAFFAQIYSEAQSSRAAPGHVAIAELHQLGRLQRHYTLNIDGLAAVVGMDTWHNENNPEGITVEMHGNISYVVCPSCHAVEPLTGKVMETMKACEPVICNACKEDEMRFKVMLYDDEQGDCITPEDVFERLEDDLAVAGAVIWVGISFEQSASTEYFRKVRHMLASHGRLHEVPQVILNPSDEPYFNVMSTMSNKEDVKVLDVRATSDDALPRVVQHLHHLGGTSPGKAAVRAAAEAAEAAEVARLKQHSEQALQPDEHCTPKASGRRKRHSGSAAASPADPAGVAVPVCQGFPAGSASYAELAAMDSAAAAALSLPAAVQKHFLQQQLQQQLQAQAEPAAQAAALGAGGRQQQPHSSAAAVDADTPAGGGVHGRLEEVRSQLHAVQALQATLASSSQQQQQKQHVAAPVSREVHSQAACALPQAPVSSLLAAALAPPPAAGAAALPLAQLATPAASSGPLEAAAALLANAPAAASLLLTNPAVLAAVVAASNIAEVSNGVATPAAVVNGAPSAGGAGCNAVAIQPPQGAAINSTQPQAADAKAPCSLAHGEAHHAPEQGTDEDAAAVKPEEQGVDGAQTGTDCPASLHAVKHESSPAEPAAAE